jgi:hypothetical protein
MKYKWLFLFESQLHDISLCICVTKSEKNSQTLSTDVSKGYSAWSISHTFTSEFLSDCFHAMKDLLWMALVGLPGYYSDLA